MTSGFSKERPLKDLITARNSSCGKVMFSQASVSHFVHKGSGGSRIFPRGVRQLPKMLLFLLPANVVCVKVMFLHLSVILLTGGACLVA